MTTFTAQCHGTCEECFGPVLPGQEVAYNVRDDLVHVDCPDARHPAVVQPGEKVCTGRHLVHAGEC